MTSPRKGGESREGNERLTVKFEVESNVQLERRGAGKETQEKEGAGTEFQSSHAVAP